MFWFKWDPAAFPTAPQPFIMIDGIKHEYSTPASGETFGNKTKLCDIINYLNPDTMGMELTPDSMNGWKKELLKLFKEWEKCYVKHCKSTHNEINGIIIEAMKPLS